MVAVSIQQVATQVGVSKAAVSMALRDHPNIPEARRRQIKKVARELGYRPSLVAQTLASQKTHTLGIVVPLVIGDTTYTPIFWAVERVARQNGYSVIMCNTDLDLNVENADFDLLYRRRVEGIIFVPGTRPNTDVEPIRELEARGIPVVVASEKPLYESSFTTVFFDNETVSKEMTEHLIGLGHRRIAFFHIGLSEAKARWEGYRRGLEAHGIAYDDSLVFQTGETTVVDEKTYDSEKVVKFLSRPNRPTAIYAHTDMLAVKVLRTLGKMGLRVPQDIALVGFDDIFVSRHLLPALTTVHQPAEEIGSRAAELLFERINGQRNDAEWPVHERIASRLIIRESCGSSLSK